MESSKKVNGIFNILLSHKTQAWLERLVLYIAIAGYLLHLFIILLNTQGYLELEQKFFKNPIAAIYTPFSFILIYEVYLLIYFLSESITKYIGKQYEIITLIVIRRIFKDISYVELTSDWFQDKSDLQFTFDVLTSIVLFSLIFLFYRNVKEREAQSVDKNSKEDFSVTKFILLKKYLAIFLVPVLFALASYTFIHWGAVTIRNYTSGILEFEKINDIFFNEFFTVLIIVDVLLLLASFFYSDKFHKIMRNSGFVISTILIKISFLAEGILNNLLIIGSVSFGCIILIIHNLYEKEDNR